MTQDILRNLAHAKATFQARTIETILTEGKPMTHEHTANEEARDALEAMTRERDRLREGIRLVKVERDRLRGEINEALARQYRFRDALEAIHEICAEPAESDNGSVRFWVLSKARAALEDN